jgi:hypothetical protein
MRCEYVTARGECKNDAEPNKRFCSKHSIGSMKTQINHYLITGRYLGGEAARHADNEQVKNIAAELALTRALLEKRFNLIQSDAELIAAIPAIRSLVETVEKLTTALHNMDTKLGNVLNKHVLLSLAQDLVKLIEDELRNLVGTKPNDQVVDLLVERLGQAMLKAIIEKDNK